MSHCSARPVAPHSRDGTDDEWRTRLVSQHRPTSRVWGQTINVLSQIAATKECCVNGRQDASEELRALDSCNRGRWGGGEEVTCVWLFLSFFFSWEEHKLEITHRWVLRIYSWLVLLTTAGAATLPPFVFVSSSPRISEWDLAVFITTSLSVNGISCKVRV